MSDTPFISIDLLAHHPHLISMVGEILWREWGHAPEPENLDWWVEATARESGYDDIPITWVAIDNQGQPVGAVGLGAFDIEERHDRSPWVLGMIVAAQYRGAGIGGQLLRTLEVWGQPRGYSHVWVATGDRAVGFYQKCGWKLQETIERPSGERVFVLARSL